MIKITDPFDPLFAPNTGTNLRNLNKKLQNKWVEENVIIGMMPEIATTPLITLRGGKALFSKKAFKAYQNALNKLRKVIKWGDVEGTVRLRDVVSKGRGSHYRSDPDQYFTDKEWAKQEFGEYRNLFAKFIKEERKAVGIGKTRTPKKAADPFDYLDKNLDRLNKQKLRLIDDIKRSEIKQAGYKHDIFPEYESEFSSGTLIDYIEELRKLQN